MDAFGFCIAFGVSVCRVATPLLFASMGGLFSERSGVVNIALEGMMLLGAWGAAVGAWWFQSPYGAVLGGVLGGVVLAFFYAVSVITFRSDQIVAGTAINFLAAGLTPFLTKIFFDSTAVTPSLSMEARFSEGMIFLLVGVFICVWFLFHKTRLGLWIRFAGEHPEALVTAGVPILRVRWFCVLTSGALAGLGGASLSTFLSSSFSRNMTAGRGFMALAALILGKWKPIPTLLACLLFGIADVLQIQLQGIRWEGVVVPVQFIQMVPYVVTVCVLAGFVGHSRPPAYLGQPWKN